MHYVLALVLLVPLCLPSRAAVVDAWRGEVDMKRSGGQQWERIAEGPAPRLQNGDELRTGRASSAELAMDDGSRVKIAPLSRFRMTSETKDAVTLGLFFGRVRSWVRKYSKKFEVRTPSAVCAVRGTDFMVASDADGNSRVEVYDGSVLTGDSRGYSRLVRRGEFAEVPAGGSVSAPRDNPDRPSDMNSSAASPSLAARREIYTEISKADVIARAQQELQSAEFQNRKVAIDALGNRVRMEEYVVRPQADQFKYVVLNTRDGRFDFGKILFTFNAALPSDLSLATRNMTSASGLSAPQWYLTAMNSVVSNTQDKVTEDASGGSMVYNGSLSAPAYQLVFNSYSFYAAGPGEAADNGGLGKWIWTKTDYNLATGVASAVSYLGQPSAPSLETSYPSGEDVFETYSRNTFADSTWIAAHDYVLFDDGKVLSAGALSSVSGLDMDAATDRLNFERVYTSSLFGGRRIDLEFSAKLLKEAGLLRF